MKIKFSFKRRFKLPNLVKESGTLSGGEAQRIRLASQIGSGLTEYCMF